MNILQAILLGFVQGLTEFLPVSSSAHLVIVKELLTDLKEPGVVFETVLHAGTMGAVLLYFKNKILELKINYLILIILGSIPAIIVGLLFSDLIEGLFTSVTVVGVALLISGLFNYFTDKADARREKIGRVDAIIVGLLQAFAIIPGISRSGATIFGGTAMGISRKTAAEFSFLLSIPAIIGANTWEIYRHGFSNGISIINYAVGFTAAFISGIIAISLLMRFLSEKNFKYFAIYCVVVGLLALFVL